MDCHNDVNEDVLKITIMIKTTICFTTAIATLVNNMMTVIDAFYLFPLSIWLNAFMKKMSQISISFIIKIKYSS